MLETTNIAVAPVLTRAHRRTGNKLLDAEVEPGFSGHGSLGRRVNIFDRVGSGLGSMSKTDDPPVLTILAILRYQIYNVHDFYCLCSRTCLTGLQSAFVVHEITIIWIYNLLYVV